MALTVGNWPALLIELFETMRQMRGQKKQIEERGGDHYACLVEQGSSCEGSGVSVFRKRKEEGGRVFDAHRYSLRVHDAQGSLPLGELLLVDTLQLVDRLLGLLIQTTEHVQILQADNVVRFSGNPRA